MQLIGLLDTVGKNPLLHFCNILLSFRFLEVTLNKHSGPDW